MLGISAFPDDHPLYLGWPGMHGQASVNRAIDRSDLLFAVGMRFDDRITGAAHKFAPNAKVVHIDIDPSELGKVIKPTVGIAADAKAAMRTILGIWTTSRRVKDATGGAKNSRRARSPRGGARSRRGTSTVPYR